MFIKEFEVQNFTYNGFYVKSKSTKAKYKAIFLEWTRDPGIILAHCTDGRKRLIPTCQLIGLQENDLPKQEKSNVIFGSSSNS